MSRKFDAGEKKTTLSGCCDLARGAKVPKRPSSGLTETRFWHGGID